MSHSGPSVQLPRYKCHKEVWALKIATVESMAQFRNGGCLIPVDERYGPIAVEEDYMRKHNPQPGGYYVVYQDGYKSYSPTQAFEEGYTLIE